MKRDDYTALELAAYFIAAAASAYLVVRVGLVLWRNI
jgi:hypothetical protein